MEVSQSGGGDDHGSSSSGSRRKGSASKRGVAAPPQASQASPCGACKFLRRKCITGCIFAPYFGSDQGAARFAAVHKVFGASNVSKLLLHIPANRRNEAVVTITYEAQARLADPVYGCVSTILALQHQVASLQGELAMVQSQLMNSRFAYSTVLQNTTQQQQQQQQQPNINMGLQPAYSNNNSSASTNLMNLSCFNTAGFDLSMDHQAAPSSHSFEPLQLSRLSQQDNEDDDEEDSKVPFVFNHDIGRGSR